MCRRRFRNSCRDARAVPPRSRPAAGAIIVARLCHRPTAVKSFPRRAFGHRRVEVIAQRHRPLPLDYSQVKWLRPPCGAKRLGLPDPTRGRATIARGVSCVDNQAAVLGDPIEIVGRVVGDDDHAVLRDEESFRQLLAIEADRVGAHVRQGGNVGIVVGYDRAPPLQASPEFRMPATRGDRRRPSCRQRPGRTRGCP